jgi:DNA-directed RNA polymerase specialized sigma subunit
LPEPPEQALDDLQRVLDDAGRALAEAHVNVATGAAWRFWRKAPRADADELRAIAYFALCQAVARFPDYQREHGYPLDDHRYLVAFIDRRVTGALLDWARGEDWVTRSQRTKAKIIEAAAENGADGTAQLAEASGLTEDEVRQVQAAQAASPICLDGDYGSSGGSGWAESLPDQSAEVESQAVVSSVLAAALRVIRGLPWQQQALLAWHYIEGGTLRAYAEAAGITPAQAVSLHHSAVLEVHDAMLAEAAEGCGCGRQGSCACA